MMIVPVASLPAQTLQVQLAGQPCSIALRQNGYGLFATVSNAGELMASNQICRNRIRIVRAAYLGFIGDLGFVDTQGNDDPYYTGLGTRWLLMYLSAAEVGA